MSIHAAAGSPTQSVGVIPMPAAVAAARAEWLENGGRNSANDVKAATNDVIEMHSKQKLPRKRGSCRQREEAQNKERKLPIDRRSA